MNYVADYFNYKRRQTTEVQIGRTPLGGRNPIRLQSMTNTDTNDTNASSEQIGRIASAGADYVRLTAQGVREASNLALIERRIHESGVSVPLVADIHFNPRAAEEAALHVEKVRINPGNFSNKGLEDIESKLLHLIDTCRAHHTALRIGVNHGSLSPRIMDRYGDTPEGMAASAMEFLRICHKANFHDVVVSMKASNTLVMMQSVRLLVSQMNEEDMHYPLHLGVTEAGSGEDGRIKSAVGIGALLADGIGDTIRVSLSEAPEAEIPVAKKLADYFAGRDQVPPIEALADTSFDPFHYHRRMTHAVEKIGGDQVPVVVAAADGQFATLEPDYVGLEALPHPEHLTYGDLTDSRLSELKEHRDGVIVLTSRHANRVGELRAAFHRLLRAGIDLPVVLHLEYNEDDLETLQIKASADAGALLLDGFGDGLCLSNAGDAVSPDALVSLSYAILQASRSRISRTEYISCPSCGRTLYDLEQTIADIRSRTSHLKGLKIGIMGCIVNGPGEMADADYGYVGAAPGRVSLYKKQVCVEKNIPTSEAVDKLIALIQENGDWHEQ
ncbi:MAG: (E)-4-hydroxy-3-methylbut-2-enyl-diphosphate synthase [Paludibacteraceae bacterium]|nr:(E)-4-hydroxy-3-methylbut-2-enyl-diphosphate synthase [Paludibacteraceae bacterium]